jgi:hypothetical protein
MAACLRAVWYAADWRDERHAKNVFINEIN